MHILIIPSEINIPEISPIWSMFQRRQAQILALAGYNIGMLCIGQLPFNQLFKKNIYRKYSICIEDEVKTGRLYKKRVLPLRFVSERIQNKINNKLALNAFTEYIKENGIPDLIHAHNCFYAGSIARTIKQMYNVPYIVTEHSSLFFGALQKEQKFLFNQVHKESRNYLAVSQLFARKLMFIADTKNKPIEIINNVLDEIFESQEIEQTKQNGSFTFLNVANLVDIKNHRLLLEAFAIKFAKTKNIKLRIVGDGPNKKYLQKLSLKLNIADQVNFLGHVNRKQVLHEMQQCDVFLLSSNSETFGVVLIEALSCGIPVISTLCGGPDEIVNKTNGILVEKGNIKAFADAMETMILKTNEYDPQLIRAECLNKYSKAAFLKNITKFLKLFQFEIHLK